MNAIDTEPVAFYRKYGFVALAEDSAQLFLPMRTIGDLLLNTGLIPLLSAAIFRRRFGSSTFSNTTAASTNVFHAFARPCP